MKSSPTNNDWHKLSYQLQIKDIESKLAVVHQFVQQFSTFEFTKCVRIGTKWDDELDDAGFRGMHAVNKLKIEVDLFVVPIPGEGKYKLRFSYQEGIDTIEGMPHEARIAEDYYIENTKEAFIQLAKMLLKLDIEGVIPP